jgi:hypothetical protein
LNQGVREYNRFEDFLGDIIAAGHNHHGESASLRRLIGQLGKSRKLLDVSKQKRARVCSNGEFLRAAGEEGVLKR